jgi:hypothetical protein
MTQHTHQTAPTQFAEANGIRFAYRRFGKPNGVPLVFNQLSLPKTRFVRIDGVARQGSHVQ